MIYFNLNKPISPFKRVTRMGDFMKSHFFIALAQTLDSFQVTQVGEVLIAMIPVKSSPKTGQLKTVEIVKLSCCEENEIHKK